MAFEKAYSFDDVLLDPHFTNIKSRKDVDISTKLYGPYSKHTIDLKVPIIAANMDTISEVEMAKTMHELGGLAIIHRYTTIDKQIQMAKELSNIPSCFSIGVVGDYFERFVELYKAGVKRFTIDIAHGASIQMVETINKLRSFANDDIFIIAGNVALGSHAYRLIKEGADCIKIGVGSGGLCTTRTTTGSGRPTLSSVLDTANTFKSNGVNATFIGDGGLKNSGDIAKCLAAGSHAVMVGSLVSGTNECCAERQVRFNGIWFKYRGMASRDSRISFKPEDDKTIVPEGEDTWVPSKGSVKDVVYQLSGGLRSSMTYNDANNLEELRENACFISISNNGLIESKPHLKL